MNFARKVILGTLTAGMAFSQSEQQEHCFLYRDDIGAHWGIKGYEEQVTEVGSHHGRLDWPQFRSWGTYDSGSVRRGTLPPTFPPGKIALTFSLLRRLPGVQQELRQLSRNDGKEVRFAAGQGLRADRVGHLGR